MSPDVFAAVILAAGQSTRMPSGKLLQPFHGQPMIRWPVQTALASGIRDVVVVTGHRADEVTLTLTDFPVTIVKNDDFADGLSSSLRCGVRAVSERASGFIVMLGDMPLVEETMLQKLVNRFDPSCKRAIGVPQYRGQRGNPVLWDRQFRNEIMTLTGDKGAKPMMALHADLVYEVEADSDAVLTDFDTPDDFYCR